MNLFLSDFTSFKNYLLWPLRSKLCNFIILPFIQNLNNNRSKTKKIIKKRWILNMKSDLMWPSMTSTLWGHTSYHKNLCLHNISMHKFSYKNRFINECTQKNWIKIREWWSFCELKLKTCFFVALQLHMIEIYSIFKL